MNLNFSFSTDDMGRLVLHRPGEEDVKDVRLRRAFPWSDPHRYVSVRGEGGKEVLLIESMESLDAPLRKIVESWLSTASFIPRITRVIEVDARFGYQQWRVDTDRGPVEFRVQEREDIRFLHDGRFSIRDADGNVYELAPLHTLDEASRKAVESII